MRLYLLLAICSIVLIGCRGNSVKDDHVTSPIPTTAKTTIQPTQSPIITLSPTVFLSSATPPQGSALEDWQEYVNEAYGFSFRYSDSWTLVERPNMISIVFPGTSIALRIRFRHPNEVVELQQYGGAAGDFVKRGTINFLGEKIEKTALVFQNTDKEIHYNGTSEINRGNIIFTLAVKSNRNFEQAVIPEEIQAAADDILESFQSSGEEA